MTGDQERTVGKISDLGRTSTEEIARSITIETSDIATERNSEQAVGNSKGKTTIKCALTTSSRTQSPANGPTKDCTKIIIVTKIDGSKSRTTDNFRTIEGSLERTTIPIQPPKSQRNSAATFWPPITGDREEVSVNGLG